MQDIVNSVCRDISQAFPGVKLFMLNKKEGIVRPAFAVYVESLLCKDINRWVFNENVTIRIIYYAPLDKVNNIDAQRQLQDYDKLAEVFQKGFIQVNDRAATIKKMRGGAIEQEIYLSINIELTRTRQDTANYELMKELNLRRE